MFVCMFVCVAVPCRSIDRYILFVDKCQIQIMSILVFAVETMKNYDSDDGKFKPVLVDLYSYCLRASEHRTSTEDVFDILNKHKEIGKI